MNAKFTMRALIGTLIVLGISGRATAAPGPYSYYGGLFPWCYPARNYYVQQRPPYFAQYPPVYYSYPVKRPYGMSPFAWPPIYHGEIARGLVDRAPSGPAAPPERKSPKLIRNRFVSGATLPDTATSTPRAETLAKPLRIVNPYVVQTERIGPILGNRSGHGPKKR